MAGDNRKSFSTESNTDSNFPEIGNSQEEILQHTENFVEVSEGPTTSLDMDTGLSLHNGFQVGNILPGICSH